MKDLSHKEIIERILVDKKLTPRELEKELGLGKDAIKNIVSGRTKRLGHKNRLILRGAYLDFFPPNGRTLSTHPRPNPSDDLQRLTERFQDFYIRYLKDQEDIKSMLKQIIENQRKD